MFQKVKNIDYYSPFEYNFLVNIFRILTGNKQITGDDSMFKKALSIILSVLIAVQIFAIGSFAAENEKNYIIENPYADINWDTWTAYKTQLHSHTNASDAYPTIHEYVQEHYDLNYDIVALTDHGTVNRGWNVAPQTVPLMRLIKYERTHMDDIIPLTEEEYQSYLNGTAQSDRRTHENGMLDVPLGIELNMATPISDCHLTGYFADYGQGLAGVYGDYETPAMEVNKLGGLTMLSHVGEFLYPIGFEDTAEHAGKLNDEYYANKFARIFLDNAGSCVGMGINSADDEFTRCDRILYDQILQKTIPNGVVPWAFCFADSHKIEVMDISYTMMYMKDLTLEEFRRCMEKGEFFSVSRYSNGIELNGMKEWPEFNKENVDTYLKNPMPMITRVDVDQENDTITVEGTDFNRITWVSDGNVILREENITDGRATLDLHSSDLLDDANLYVRFYVTGNDGICYSQPFVLNVEGEEFESVTVPETQDISTSLRKLVTIIDAIFFKFNPIIWAFKYFALGYDPITQAFGK